MRRHNAKKVVWTAPKEEPKPQARHLHWTSVESAEAKLIIAKRLLVPGALFTMLIALRDEVTPKGVVEPPYPYTVNDWSGSPVIRAGDLAIYAGTVRVEEQSGTRIMRVLRHTFIVGGGRRIVDLNNVRHVDEIFGT